MKLKTMAALAVGVLPIFTVVLTGSPASAKGQECPADTFCLYSDVGWEGERDKYRPGQVCTLLKETMNNNAESMRNYRSYSVKLWDMPGCGGSLTYIAHSFSKDADFEDNSFLNKASSLSRA